MSDDLILEGGCLCGALRYRIEGAPRVVSHCHCSLCRRVSGAAFVTWLTVKKDRVTLTGEPAWYDSTDWGRRGFCPTCGTNFIAVSAHYERYYDITAGSLDDPGHVHPCRHVFAGSKVDWVRIDESLPAHIEGARSPLIGEEAE